MKLGIKREGDEILTVTDFKNPKDRGEISHFIVQLELLKNELIVMFDEYGDDVL